MVAHFNRETFSDALLTPRPDPSDAEGSARRRGAYGLPPTQRSSTATTRAFSCSLAPPRI
jgi:hypothetical protein